MNINSNPVNTHIRFNTPESTVHMTSTSADGKNNENSNNTVNHYFLSNGNHCSGPSSMSLEFQGEQTSQVEKDDCDAD